jgi:hypothetical protein
MSRKGQYAVHRELMLHLPLAEVDMVCPSLKMALRTRGSPRRPQDGDQSYRHAQGVEEAAQEKRLYECPFQTNRLSFTPLETSSHSESGIRRSS